MIGGILLTTLRRQFGSPLLSAGLRNPVEAHYAAAHRYRPWRGHGLLMSNPIEDALPSE